jgi:hypothetical protein
MFSQLFSRSTAIRRNSFGYRPTRFFATFSECLIFGVQSTIENLKN